MKMIYGLIVLTVVFYGSVFFINATEPKAEADGIYVSRAVCSSGDCIENVLYIDGDKYTMSTNYLNDVSEFHARGRVDYKGNDLISISDLYYEVNDHGLRQLDIHGNKLPSGVPCTFLKVS